MTERNTGDRDQPTGTQVTGYFLPLAEDAAANAADLRDAWRRLKKGKAVILGFVAAALIGAALVAFMTTPVYRSQILLAPAQVEDQRGQLASLVGQYAPGLQPGALSSGLHSRDQAIAVLESRRFTEEFIRSEALLPVLFADAWDADKETWKSGNPDDRPTMADAVSLFAESIRRVHEDNRRNLVTLQIDWTNPQQAADWANLLVERLNDHLRNRDIEEAQRSIEFLNRELAKSSVIGLQQGIFRLIEQQIELVMLANVRDEYAFKILDPAVPADAGDYVRPKRLLILIVGLMLGLFLGVSLVLLRPE